MFAMKRNTSVARNGEKTILSRKVLYRTMCVNMTRSLLLYLHPEQPATYEFVKRVLTHPKHTNIQKGH